MIIAVTAARLVPAGPYEIEELGRDVLEMMDARELQQAHYCGLSLGGMVGMWLGANAAERVDRLILLCTASYMPPASMWQERAVTVRRAGSVEPLADATLDRWLTPEFAGVHPEVRASSVWTCAMGAGHPGSDAGGFRRPGPLYAARATGAGGSRHPEARHEIVGPVAHLAAVEQPEAVNRLILEHLGRSSTRRG